MPRSIRHLGGNMLKIYFLEVPLDPAPEIERILYPLISARRRKAIDDIREEVDRRLRVCGYALLRVTMSEIARLPNRKLHFSEDAFGKLHFLGPSDIHFNLSHTRHAVILGLSSEVIGVDIEKPNQADRLVANEVFTPNEKQYIFSTRQSADERFNEVWTRKEAFAKRTGLGWTPDLRFVDILSGESAGDIRSILYQGYTISACASNIREFDSVSPVDFQDLVLRARLSGG